MKLAILLAASLALAGCCCFMFQGDPYYNEYTRAKPDEKDLVGVWVANARSLEWLKEKGYAVAAPPSLEIRADGTFDVLGMPDCWRVFSDTEWAKTFDSAAGKWKLDRHQEWWAVECTYDKPPWFPEGSYNSEFFLRRQKPPYMVHAIIGDPDAGECIEFERR